VLDDQLLPVVLTDVAEPGGQGGLDRVGSEALGHRDHRTVVGSPPADSILRRTCPTPRRRPQGWARRAVSAGTTHVEVVVAEVDLLIRGVAEDVDGHRFEAQDWLRSEESAPVPAPAGRVPSSHARNRRR